MFRIRRIYDDSLAINKKAIAQVQDIFRNYFTQVSEEKILSITEQLSDPFKYQFRTTLFVADDLSGNVKGFALAAHDTKLRFTYLDTITTSKARLGRGIGSSLYQALRDESRKMKEVGIFMEVLPDDPVLCSDPVMLKENRSRLKFYERFGVRPIIGTRYETPITPGGDNPPYLLYDDLGSGIPLNSRLARKIVRAILIRKYAELCSPAYVDMVLQSFKSNPVELRPPRYIDSQSTQPEPESVKRHQKILLIINEKHNIHHIHERGYVESPVRIRAIMKELDKTDLFLKIPASHFPESHINQVHDPKYIRYLKAACAQLGDDESLYPYVFPIRNNTRPPKELTVRAGYYCIDTFTPIHRNAYLAARGAVDCALTGAQKLLEGHDMAYALVRPPGHHAEYGTFGGFCYLNSNAIAAQYLSKHGSVAILDVDYHHGNGQQGIFYDRPDVLTVSIHGHPNIAYPYFSGFKDETGEGAGIGFNMNIPLHEIITAKQYDEALGKALVRITKISPAYLVLALGLDTARGDPTGSWGLLSDDFYRIGKVIGTLGTPVLIVQEGGYNTRNIGKNARSIIQGLWDGYYRD